MAVLDPRPKERLGYKDHSDILKLAFFEGMTAMLESGETNFPPLDIQPAVDPSSVFIEAELDPYNSAVYDQF